MTFPFIDSYLCLFSFPRFRPMWGGSTGHLWISHTKDSYDEPEHAVKQSIKLPVIRDVMTLMRRNFNVIFSLCVFPPTSRPWGELLVAATQCSDDKTQGYGKSSGLWTLFPQCNVSCFYCLSLHKANIRIWQFVLNNRWQANCRCIPIDDIFIGLSIKV